MLTKRKEKIQTDVISSAENPAIHADVIVHERLDKSLVEY